jgi:U3 small nucleolar RNA-associated protein 5
LQDRLLSLSGKLDLVLAQAELRSSHAPAPLKTQKNQGKKIKRDERQPTKYVEGESSEEDDQVQIEVADDGDDDEGSIEDVELGCDDLASEDEEDEDEEEADDEEGNLVNGFIDDEAEDYEDDDSGADSE